MNNKTRIIALSKALEGLTPSQLQWVEALVEQFQRGAEFKLISHHDIFNECMLNDFGDTLRIHHCFSKEPFTKDKFEYALERVVNLCGGKAKLAPKGQPQGNRIKLFYWAFFVKACNIGLYDVRLWRRH